MTATSTQVMLWQINSAQPIHTLPMDTHPVQTLAFNPKGDLLAVGTGSQLSLWQAETPTLLQTLSVQETRITRILWRSDGEELLCGCSDGSIRVWHPEER